MPINISNLKLILLLAVMVSAAIAGSFYYLQEKNNNQAQVNAERSHIYSDYSNVTKSKPVQLPNLSR